jgi:hypothetical protein
MADDAAGGAGTRERAKMAIAAGTASIVTTRIAAVERAGG